MSATNRAHVLLWTDGATAYLDAIQAAGLADRVAVDTLPRKEKPSPEQLARTEALMAGAVPAGLLPAMPRLRWAQAMSAGVDNWLALPDLPPGLTLTCARGTHTESMPENIIGALFHVAKPYAQVAEYQKQGKWVHTVAQPLTGKTLGILGLGVIGQEVARIAVALGMHVIGTKRRPTRIPNVAEVLAPSQTDEVLAQSDFVLLLLPATPETENFIDAKRLAADEAVGLAAELRPRPDRQRRRSHGRHEGEEDRRRVARRVPAGAAAIGTSLLDGSGHRRAAAYRRPAPAARPLRRAAFRREPETVSRRRTAQGSGRSLGRLLKPRIARHLRP